MAHAPKPLTISLQSNFFDVGVEKFASNANLLLITEPALLDNFIGSIHAMSEGHQADAQLEAIQSPWTA